MKCASSNGALTRSRERGILFFCIASGASYNSGQGTRGCTPTMEALFPTANVNLRMERGMKVHTLCTMCMCRYVQHAGNGSAVPEPSLPNNRKCIAYVQRSFARYFVSEAVRAKKKRLEEGTTGKASMATGH